VEPAHGFLVADTQEHAEQIAVRLTGVLRETVLIDNAVNDAIDVA
jgi:hypothetical protein